MVAAGSRGPKNPASSRRCGELANQRVEDCEAFGFEDCVGETAGLTDVTGIAIPSLSGTEILVGMGQTVGVGISTTVVCDVSALSAMASTPLLLLAAAMQREPRTPLNAVRPAGFSFRTTVTGVGSTAALGEAAGEALSPLLGLVAAHA